MFSNEPHEHPAHANVHAAGTSSTSAGGLYTVDEQRTLLDVARSSIIHGLSSGRPLTVEPATFTPALREHRAAFVTLHRQEKLRGCIGSLEPRRPLVTEVAANAFAAAFRDPRFEPLTQEERADLRIHLSVLEPPVPVSFVDEADLIRQLRPHVDGLILRDPASGRQSTFLPSVWASVPEPQRFLAQLRLKARLDPDHPLTQLQVQRYRVYLIGPPG